MAQHIVKMNMNATSILIEGRHDEAVSLFRIALRKTRELLAGTSTGLPKVRALPDSREQFIYCTSLIGTTSSSQVDVAGFIFFNKVFCVKNAITSQDYDQLALILLFNIAVAHHGKGSSTGSTKELAVALKYYKMALELIHHIAEHNELDSLLLLILALWNNMGNIHSQFFNVREVRKCADWMETLIECSDCRTLEDDEYDFFRLNLLANPQLGISLAPAA